MYVKDLLLEYLLSPTTGMAKTERENMEKYFPVDYNYFQVLVVHIRITGSSVVLVSTHADNWVLGSNGRHTQITRSSVVLAVHIQIPGSSVVLASTHTDTWVLGSTGQ